MAESSSTERDPDEVRTISFKIAHRRVEAITERADEEGMGRSEYIRYCLESVPALEAELESERARAEDLRRQLAAQNSRSGDVEEVVEYVASEKELRSEQAAREQRRREAPLWRRAKWRLVGEPPLDRAARTPQ